jgi:branched-chain amino acid transport system substrate-binding protein
MRKSSFWSGLGLVTAAVLVTACGSSSTPAGSSSSPATTNAASTPGSTSGPATGSSGGAPTSGATSAPTSGGTASGDPIRIGYIGSDTGGFKATYGRGKDTITAWVKYVNDTGGLNGHPVEVVTKDDAGDPATGLKVAKELAESDKVMAVVGEASGTSSSWAPYLETAGVPVVGGPPVQMHFATNANSFPTGAGVLVTQYGQVKMAKDAGKTKIGLAYCAESPVCDLSAIFKTATGIVGGIELANASSVAATTSDYSATCLAMKGAGVDALYSTLEAAATQRLFADCRRQGVDAIPSEGTGSYDTAWLTDPELDGALITSGQAMWTDANTPGAAAFMAALGKYAPDLVPEINSTVQTTWLGGELFRAAAVAGKLGPTSTPADVKKALYQLKDETLGGLAAPLNYAEGKPTVLACYFQSTITGGALKALDDNKPSCLSPDDLTQMATALTKK